MDNRIIEQAKIVNHYIDNMDEYPCNDDGYWGGLKATVLKDKSKYYINQVDKLINERIELGKVAFNKKYNII